MIFNVVSRDRWRQLVVWGIKWSNVLHKNTKKCLTAIKRIEI